MSPMKKFLPKLLTVFILTISIQFPSVVFSATSSKKSSIKSTKHPKKAQAPKEESIIPPQPAEPTGPPLSQLVTAYKYAYELYAAHQFAKANDIFKKISLVTNNPTLKANYLFYFSQCAF